MLSPVAVSLDDRQVDDGVPVRPGGAAGARARLGEPGLLRQPEDRPKLTIMVLDAWTFIPFMMIMLLAGLQALPREMHGGGPRRRRERLADLLARSSSR